MPSFCFVTVVSGLLYEDASPLLWPGFLFLAYLFVRLLLFRWEKLKLVSKALFFFQFQFLVSPSLTPLLEDTVITSNPIGIWQ